MKRKLIVAIIVGTVVLSGCTQIKALFGNNDAMLELATKAATARLLMEKPQWKQPTADITSAAISAIDIGQTATLSDVTNLVMSKIPMNKLTLEEKALVSMLVNQLTVAIVTELQKQGVQNPATQLVEVKKVLTWVNQVAIIK